ncbi:MAG: SDR family oxidoreductase [Rhodocyclaceae bacterium]|jgi:NAD(P)-dependent dehydrogenase (short-subunit alcohol dehydrogenase family)|nr:SDR family oxidoreductase [Rhodocyclaceae bacterium]
MSSFTADALAHKVAFVAGGTSGINLGIAQRLAAHGARVVVMGRNPDKAAAAATTITAAGGQALGLAADVRDYAAMEAALQRTVDHFGPIDIVISGAAGNFVAPATGMSANAFKTVVDIDLLGTFNVFRAAHAHLKKPGASLIAISAEIADMAAWGQSHACAAKAGVDMLVRTLALELGPEGIRVNSIRPGPIENTEGMARLISPEAKRDFLKWVPLGRLGQASEVGDSAVFLCSDAARYVTGTVLSCDGGFQHRAGVIFKA